MYAWLPRMGNSSSRGGRRGRDPYWQQQQHDNATSLNMSYQVDAAAQPPYVKQPGANSMPPMPPAAEPNSLLDYFSSKLPAAEDVVDVDDALADLDEGPHYPPELQVTNEMHPLWFGWDYYELWFLCRT